MALCTYKKFSTINPALLKKGVKKSDGRKSVKMLFIQHFKNVLMFEPSKDELQNV